MRSSDLQDQKTTGSSLQGNDDAGRFRTSTLTSPAENHSSHIPMPRLKLKLESGFANFANFGLQPQNSDAFVNTPPNFGDYCPCPCPSVVELF